MDPARRLCTILQQSLALRHRSPAVSSFPRGWWVLPTPANQYGRRIQRQVTDKLARTLCKLVGGKVRETNNVATPTTANGYFRHSVLTFVSEGARCVCLCCINGYLEHCGSIRLVRSGHLYPNQDLKLDRRETTSIFHQQHTIAAVSSSLTRQLRHAWCLAPPRDPPGLAACAPAPPLPPGGGRRYGTCARPGTSEESFAVTGSRAFGCPSRQGSKAEGS